MNLWLRLRVLNIVHINAIKHIIRKERNKLKLRNKKGNILTAQIYAQTFSNTLAVIDYYLKSLSFLGQSRV